MRNLNNLVVSAALGEWVAFPDSQFSKGITGIITKIDKNGGG